MVRAAPPTPAPAASIRSGTLLRRTGLVLRLARGNDKPAGLKKMRADFRPADFAIPPPSAIDLGAVPALKSTALNLNPQRTQFSCCRTGEESSFLHSDASGNAG